MQVTFSDGRKPQHCISTANLNGLLPLLSSIRAKRQIKSERFKIDYTLALAKIEMRDSNIVESMSPWYYRSKPDHSAIALEHEAYTVEVDTKISLFDKLNAGCAAFNLGN